MYKVFLNDKVIIFTNNEDDYKKLEHQLVLKFFSKEQLPFIIELLQSDDKMSVVFVVPNIEEAFNEFKTYFKIIAAAGGIVSNKKNKKLFIYRLDKWDLPKGKIEQGENIKEAAVREIEEECGITDLTIINQLKDTFHIYTLNKQLILKKTYWFELTSSFDGKLIPQLEEAITKAEWLTDAEINTKVLNNTYASIKELL